jgi:2-polyprenyl-3-methyl-5-hydroxy-6-metoxy-1,4-benzoquinol methylase
VYPNKSFKEMDLEKYLNNQKDIAAYKIVDNKTVYYSTNDDFINRSSNDSKFWGKLFDLSYQKMEMLSDALNSTEVWKNSYDGSNFSEIEMKEWLNDTIARINKLISEDCNVLEIGCGNGLIFNSIIDNVSKYIGTDIAEKGLELIANSKKGKLNASKIELYQLDALNIDKIPNNKFNLIIINSVAQYFPSLDYLFNVLKKIEAYASTNCYIFLGDIRSYELQKLFYLDILDKKSPKLSEDELNSKINFLKTRENETFYHTQLFKLFPTLFDYINSHFIELKKGKYNNELNLYRYDVTLLCNSNIDHKEIISLKWGNFENPEAEISKQLQSLNKNEVLEISNIPNSRYIHIANKYIELFPSDDSLFFNNTFLQNDIVIPSVSFFTVLAEKENVFIHTKFNKEDFLKFDVYLSKEEYFNIPQSNDEINLQLLSNKLEEKKNNKDKVIEEQIHRIFSGVQLIKVSNYLLSE